MKTPTRFIPSLTTEERQELDQLMKTHGEHIRRRAHAVILSARGFSIDQIAHIYEVDRDTVSLWLSYWEQDHTTGLLDEKGRGRKPLLNAGCGVAVGHICLIRRRLCDAQASLGSDAAGSLRAARTDPVPRRCEAPGRLNGFPRPGGVPS